MQHLPFNQLLRRLNFLIFAENETTDFTSGHPVQDLFCRYFFHGLIGLVSVFLVFIA